MKQHYLILLVILLIFFVGIIGFLLGFKNGFSINALSFNKEIPTTANTQLAVVVPHHDLVKETRAKLLEKLSQNLQPQTIILLAPDHFSAGAMNATVSKQDWTVANGQKILSADTALINGLVKNNLVATNDAAFDNEHGIKNLLGEIKEFFPGAKLVPIIFKDSVRPAVVKELSDFIINNCAFCSVIASVDMSHYQPAHIAQLHDIKTLRALASLDEQEIWQAEVDSNASLAFLLSWAKSKNLNNFVLFDHTNSGLLANNFDTETTTHIFGYYAAGLSAPVEDSLTFTFAGDAMFGRNIGYQFQQNNFKDLFANLGNRVFWGTDLSWLNLEGPISDKIILQPRSIPDLKFNFSNQTIEALKYLRLTTAGLANNHTLNQGSKALAATRDLLESSGIDWQGNPNEADEGSIRRYEQNNIKISLIAINPTFGITNIEELIKQEKQAGRLIIVLPHWGNEYEKNHSAGQEKLARAWIEAGADLIIGGHPHVIQDAQIIDGKLIFYSLGNFIFDQTFSQETKQGLIVAGEINKETIKIVLLPIESKNLKPEILQGGAKKQILEKICKNITDYCQYDLIEIARH